MNFDLLNFSIEIQADLECNPKFSEDPKSPRINSATLNTNVSSVELKIYYDPENYFGEKVFEWIDTINSKKIGSFFLVHNASENADITQIYFTEAKLLKCSYGTEDDEGIRFCVFMTLDWVRIERPSEQGKQSQAKFLLNNNGFSVASKFFILFRREKNSFTMHQHNKTSFVIQDAAFDFGFDYTYSDRGSNRTFETEKNPYLKLEGVKDELEAIRYAQMICDVSTFYHQTKVGYFYCKIYLSDKVISIRSVQNKDFQADPYNLFHLEYSDNFEKFLRTEWWRGFSFNFKKLTKAIDNYNLAYKVDPRSTYLLLYNIFEILASGRQPSVQRFESILDETEESEFQRTAFEYLLKTIHPNEHKEFINKWEGIAKNLRIKQSTSAITDLINEVVDVTKLPVSVKELAEIRNKITHGSSKIIPIDDLDFASRVIFRITGVLMLKMIGVAGKVDLTIKK